MKNIRTITNGLGMESLEPMDEFEEAQAMCSHYGDEAPELEHDLDDEYRWEDEDEDEDELSMWADEDEGDFDNEDWIE